MAWYQLALCTGSVVPLDLLVSLGSVPIIVRNCVRVISWALIWYGWVITLILVTVPSRWNRPAGTPTIVRLKLRVAGKTAVTVPELAAFVTVAPVTVKLSAATPVRVQPAFGASTISAAYILLAPKGYSRGNQLIVPVYCAVSMALVTAIAPVTGAVTPGMARRVMGESTDCITGSGQPVNTRAASKMPIPEIFRVLRL